MNSLCFLSGSYSNSTRFYRNIVQLRFWTANDLDFRFRGRVLAEITSGYMRLFSVTFVSDGVEGYNTLPGRALGLFTAF